ncbi:hypothetical protein [Cellulomonas xylanilytica]|uniref:Uncharacterized protein n=1 Tax=Cellulomonas xylanilytica TaxID=233583 RepID=A0A510VCI9_9CELL|nr:hypothetical protein [Cellulomonas xylanilytica]GEK22875.1 hypothetical protein CXY01_33950 [Cellulomonas xylanilytica]
MTQILAFIAAHMGYLWATARYRITDSQVTRSNGGDAFLVMESTDLRLRFVQDRMQLSLELQSTLDAAHEWYSIDLVRRLFLGEPESSSLLDASYARFVGEHLDELDERFGPQRWLTTQGELQQIRAQRSKELWG